jgi:hypothetical protein
MALFDLLIRLVFNASFQQTVLHKLYHVFGASQVDGYSHINSHQINASFD